MGGPSRMTAKLSIQGRKGDHREGTVSPRCGRRGSGLAGARTLRTDRPRGVLPREGRLDQGGQEGLPDVRRTRRVPRVRLDERRALRNLGRALRARAAEAEEARGLRRYADSGG